MTGNYLPEIGAMTREIRRGRCVLDGYQRGWGLQFGEVVESVLADPVYRRAMALAAPRIIQAEMNRMNVFLILRFFLADLPAGDVVEFGSYRGGSAIFIASVLREIHPNARVYALDTYEGIPQADKSVDAHNAGDFGSVDYDEMVACAAAQGLDNLHFVRGRFEDTWPRLQKDAGRPVALAHIDCDVKSAVRYAFDAVRPSMVPGGYIVFDDATVSSCIGATEAVEEVIQERHIFSEQIWPHYVFRHGLGG